MKKIATASAVAFIVYSCKGKLSLAENLDLSETPVQTVDSMFVVQTDNGLLQMRMEADLMQRFDNDSVSYEKFPKGFSVFGYTDDGKLETYIISDNACHHKNKKNGKEYWSAFGNVVIENILKKETMETDTIYWDQTNHEIYTDCYVKMFSPDGFMQGYGMRSDEHARNSIILKPFNSYGIVVQDTSLVVIDSVNFIGPLLKK
ncbi:MAG: LPS export ABC transporter periplasmic protein LptC [Bacteroidales bacterium]|jgi:LPS export ABC transporter protein LptC|nr:LPS export ABC transporter periplasmic protein LptC [Bacteroidales bacterium]MCI1784849.1 LPS export ABC transporter periplasmic protein LptC [Bacteroidales bacterium]